MPVVRVLLVLLFGLLFSGPAAWAQQAPGARSADTKPAPVARPRREQRVLTVHLPLPSLVARLGEATGLLERPAAKNRRATANDPVPDDPVLVFTLPLPKLFSSKAVEKPVPATP